MMPWLKVLSKRLEKYKIEPTMPGLQGEWFIDYTAGGSTDFCIVEN